MPFIRWCRWSAAAAVAVAVATPLAAQQPDSLHARPDSTPPVVELKDITITTTRSRVEEPASAVSISPAMLQRTPALNPWDLLRQTAGLEVHDQGQGPGFASDASLRGFSSDHSTDLALWVDGVPVNEPVNGHAEGYNDWSLLFPQALQDLDVIKGPTSALFGNFALAGVVNVRTLERMQGSEGFLSGGAYGRLEGAVLTGVDQEHTGAVVGFRGLREDGWRPNSGYTLGQAHGRVVRDLSSRVALDAGVELYASGWDSPGFLTVQQFGAREYDVVSDPTDGGSKRRAQERVSVRVQTGAVTTWRSTLYATQGRWELFLTTPPEGGGGEGSTSQTFERDHRHGFGATSALTWTQPHAELTVGVEGRLDRSDYQNWFSTRRVRDSVQTMVDARQLSGAVFLQSGASLTDRLRLSVGGRYETSDTRSEPAAGATVSATKGVFAPKVGALYRLTSAVGVYGNVSRGFRRTDGVIEDPTLPFITAWAYETGVKIDAGPVRGSVALFRMDVSDEQTFNPITLSSTSGGESRRQGIEFDLRARLTGGLRLTTNVTLNDAKYRRLVTADGDTLSGARVFNTAKYLGSATLEVAPSGAAWFAQLGTNVVGPYTPFDEPTVELHPYALLHLSAGWSVGRALLQLGVRNVLDHAYPELRAGGFVVPGQPRTVYGTARYFF